MIVGIGHVARVGKDVAAKALCRDLGFERRAFADKIKDLALKMDPLVTSQTQTTNIGVGRGRLQWVVQGMGWDEAKTVYPEVRTFLQGLGQGAREVFGEDFWVDQCLPKSATARTKMDIVVSDVRYRNEAEAIRRVGGKLIRINRPGHHGQGHSSETDLLDFDWDLEIMNDGALVDLETKVVQAVKDWQK